MKQIQAHLRREIFRADKKKRKLQKKLLGFTSKINDSNFDLIEVIVQRDDFLNENKRTLNFDEYAYCLKDGTFSQGIAKIKNHKLKEYYESTFFRNTLQDNPYAKGFSGRFEDCLNSLEKYFKKEDLLSGFYINKVYYRQVYSSINTKNEITDYYFNGSTCLCPIKEFLGMPCVLVIRMSQNNDEFRISRVYIFVLDENFLKKVSQKYNITVKTLFFYYDKEDLNSFKRALLRIY